MMDWKFKDNLKKDFENREDAILKISPSDVLKDADQIAELELAFELIKNFKSAVEEKLDRLIW